MKKTNNLILGTILIVVGIILGLKALDIININIFFKGWWTLFIIIPSCIGLINDYDKIGNLIGIIIGLVLLLICQNIIDFELLLRLAIPVILVLIGLNLILKNSQLKSQEAKKVSPNRNKDTKDYCATLTGMNVKLDDESVERYKLDAIFGSLNADLTKHKLKKELQIIACSIFGNITLTIPEEVNIKILSTPIFGKVSDQRKLNSQEKRKTIYLDGTAFFGNIKIK